MSHKLKQTVNKSSFRIYSYFFFIVSEGVCENICSMTKDILIIMKDIKRYVTNGLDEMTKNDREGDK